MAGGQAPGANSRGRGGKFRKFTRGGGKHFSRDLRPLDADGNEISMWSENAEAKGSSDDDSDDSEEESSEEDSDDEPGPSGGAASAAAAASREDRKAQKKARKDAAIKRSQGRTVQVGDLPSSDDDDESDADLPANPNHTKASRKQTAAVVPTKQVDATADAVKKLSINAAPANRRERESMEAQQAKEKYRKLHEAGKTDEAKADLARLAIIREKRAAEAARKQVEKEEKEEKERARKAEIEATEAKLREAALGKHKKGKK